MSLQILTLATALGVGSSAAVKLNVTPFIPKDSAVAFIQPIATNDRTWTLEKSDDGGTTWSTTLTGGGAALVMTEVAMSADMRLTVAGGTVGTIDAKLLA